MLWIQRQLRNLQFKNEPGSAVELPDPQTTASSSTKTARSRTKKVIDSRIKRATSSGTEKAPTSRRIKAGPSTRRRTASETRRGVEKKAFLNEAIGEVEHTIVEVEAKLARAVWGSTSRLLAAVETSIVQAPPPQSLLSWSIPRVMYLNDTSQVMT